MLSLDAVSLALSPEGDVLEAEARFAALLGDNYPAGFATANLNAAAVLLSELNPSRFSLKKLPLPKCDSVNGLCVNDGKTTVAIYRIYTHEELPLRPEAEPFGYNVFLDTVLHNSASVALSAADGGSQMDGYVVLDLFTTPVMAPAVKMAIEGHSSRVIQSLIEARFLEYKIYTQPVHPVIAQNSRPLIDEIWKARQENIDNAVLTEDALHVLSMIKDQISGLAHLRQRAQHFSNEFKSLLSSLNELLTSVLVSTDQSSIQLSCEHGIINSQIIFDDLPTRTLLRHLMQRPEEFMIDGKYNVERLLEVVQQLGGTPWDAAEEVEFDYDQVAEFFERNNVNFQHLLKPKSTFISK